jgi:hypothetical protein
MVAALHRLATEEQAPRTDRRRDTMKFGLCYIPDYHQELSGSWQDWYEGMIEEVKLAERLGFHGAWSAEHRVPGFAFASPAMFIATCARETSRIRLGVLGQPAAAEQSGAHRRGAGDAKRPLQSLRLCGEIRFIVQTRIQDSQNASSAVLMV